MQLYTLSFSSISEFYLLNKWFPFLWNKLNKICHVHEMFMKTLYHFTCATTIWIIFGNKLSRALATLSTKNMSRKKSAPNFCQLYFRTGMDNREKVCNYSCSGPASISSMPTRTGSISSVYAESANLELIWDSQGTPLLYPIVDCSVKFFCENKKLTTTKWV